MNFGEQIKKLRKQKNLTQEQMASQLGISRQAVSNWENDRNLPDIEMLISIAVTFQISLDDLILGGRDMNNMTEKLIKDGSENRRAKMNLISTCIGAGLLLGGVACFIAKALTPVTLNADGLLQESFFLLPVGALLMFAGFLVFAVTGFRNILFCIRPEGRSGETGEKRNAGTFAVIGSAVVLFCIGFVLILRQANGGGDSAAAGMILMAVSVAGSIFAGIRMHKKY